MSLDDLSRYLIFFFWFIKFQKCVCGPLWSVTER